MKKTLKWISNVTTYLLFVLLIAMVSLVIMMKFSSDGQTVFGYQLKTVLSGSMEPGIKTGSIIAVQPGGDTTRFKNGDIITFQMDKEGNLTTHRVIEVRGNGETTSYITKGDNNNGPDTEPVLNQNVVAEYTGFTVPYIGYLLNYTQSKLGSALLFVIPGIIFLGYAAFTIIQAIRKIDEPKQDETTEV